MKALDDELNLLDNQITPNIFQKYGLKIIFYLLMILNLGISTVNPGYFYIYTTRTNTIALVVMLVMIIGIIPLVKFDIHIDNNLFIFQVLYIITTIITIIINGKDLISSSLFLSTIPLLICILTIALVESDDGFKFITHFIAIFALLLSFQTIAICLDLYLTTGSLSKGLIITSVGGSNFIAAHLIVCFIFLLLSRKQLRLPYFLFCIIITFIAIILTISFGAIITLLIVLSLIAIFQSKPGSMQPLLFILGIFGVIIFLLYVIFLGTTLINSENTIIVNFMMKIQYFIDGNYTRLFSSRDIIYRQSIDTILERPIFGYDGFLIYKGVETRTHNWILDILISKGIVGAVIFIIMMGYSLRKIHHSSILKPELTPIKYALFTGLIHGMVEPNLFSRTFDFLWWVLIGIAIGEIMKMNQVDLIINDNIEVS